MTTEWKHGNIISRMSLEEKAALLNGASEWTTREIRRLGIEALVFSDGPNGVRRQRGKGDHLGLNASVPATCFPALSALACSWDEALLYRVGQALGEEARTLGVDVLLGPGLNIRRNPAGGRNFEYFSEDPFLSGKEAAAFIRGIQSTGISACPKHFAVNSQELHRMTVDSVLDERALRELYLTGFEIALKEGGAHAIMTSYNKVNGSYANENTHLLLEILRKEWKYDGFVVTDWGGCNDPAKGAACRSDLSMPGAGYVPVHEIVQAVLDSRLPMEALEQCVEDTLELQRKTAPGRKNRAAGYDPEKHHILARKAAAQSVVLLKNQGKPSRLLPLSENTRAALIGAFGSSPRYQGAGSSAINPSRLESLSQVIGNYLPRYTGYAAGYTPGRKRDPAKERKALSLAEKSELILYCMGLDECSELEGRDRKNLAIPEEQILLLQKLYEVNPNIVVLLSAGAAVDLWWENYCSGIVYGQLGGQAGASAVLEILLGKICPSGRLSETWPLRYEDTPSYGYFPGPERTAEYRESIFVGYRYYHSAQIRVRYPFGYGLSYTSFSYSDLKTDDRGVSFEIRNTGDRDGAEVAQLYVGIKKSRVFRAARELKGFHKVFLRAGQLCPQDIQRFCSAPLDGTPGQSQGLANLAVCQVQNQAQNQNALLLLRQTGKGVGHLLASDRQVTATVREHIAVAGVVVSRTQLVHRRLRQTLQGRFPAGPPLHFPDVVDCLMLQHGFIKGIKSAPFAIVAGVGFHLLTPFRLGMVVVLSLSANRAFSGTGFARKTAFRREKIKENFRAAGNDKNRPAGHRPAGRFALYSLLYLYRIV